MLWLKAWRESRVRFLLVAGMFLAMCLQFLLTAHRSFPPPEVPSLPYTAFVWGNLIGNRQPILFAVAAMVLGLGGLQRERATGTVAFTLVLPVTRRSLLAVRAVMGVAQVTALALGPLLLVALGSPVLAGHEYPLGQAIGFGLLYLSWGLVFFAGGVLWSTLLSGALSALTACVLSPFVCLIATNWMFDERSGPSDMLFPAFMSGRAYFDRAHGAASVLGDVFPWTSIVVLAGVAALIVAAAYWRTALQDF